MLREARHPVGRQRVPEPMVMDEADSVAQFHAGGVSSPGMQAVYDFSARALNALLPEGARLLDLGVGSGRALGHVARLRADVRATGVDLAPNMLATARAQFEADGLSERIELVEADMTKLPAELVDAPWDGISCVWTLHQLPDLDVLRGALRQIAALRERTGAAVWIFDFCRLRNPATFPAMLSVLDSSMPPVLRKDGIASEAAAFSHDELIRELQAAGLDDLQGGRARPLPWVQAFWAPRADGRAGGSRALTRVACRARRTATPRSSASGSARSPSSGSSRPDRTHISRRPRSDGRGRSSGTEQAFNAQPVRKRMQSADISPVGSSGPRPHLQGFPWALTESLTA